MVELWLNLVADHREVEGFHHHPKDPPAGWTPAWWTPAWRLSLLDRLLMLEASDMGIGGDMDPWVLGKKWIICVISIAIKEPGMVINQDFQITTPFDFIGKLLRVLEKKDGPWRSTKSMSTSWTQQLFFWKHAIMIQSFFLDPLLEAGRFDAPEDLDFVEGFFFGTPSPSNCKRSCNPSRSSLSFSSVSSFLPRPNGTRSSSPSLFCLRFRTGFVFGFSSVSLGVLLSSADDPYRGGNISQRSGRAIAAGDTEEPQSNRALIEYHRMSFNSYIRQSAWLTQVMILTCTCIEYIIGMYSIFIDPII